MKVTQDKLNMTYDTQWIHDYLGPDQCLYFKAKTPVQEIVHQLENVLKKKDLKIDYKAPFIINNFSRLYRNWNNSYKGWRVFYRKPDASSEKYHSIQEQIGVYVNTGKNSPNRSIKQTLNQTMVWTHRLYPEVQPVNINKAKTCEAIAEQLNLQFSKGSNSAVLLKKGSSYIEDFYRNYHELLNNNHERPDLLKNTNSSWESFSKNLKNINRLYNELQALNVKTFTMSHTNVYDILMSRRKNAKGWRVEFLDKNG